MNRSRFLILLPSSALAVSSTLADDTDLPALQRAVVAHHARLAHAAYGDSRVAADMLQQAVADFLTAPCAERMALARQAWLAARVPYLQTEVCRFYDGPIEQVEGFINAWPMDESLIDYIIGEPRAGIIHATQEFPRLTKELLLSLNEQEGEKNISVGFHAIEFLLWGQDTNPKGPGNRPWQDYDLAKAGDAHSPVARRREYLRLTCELLSGHLRQVEAAWAPGRKGNFREQFVTQPAAQSLTLILKGAGTLSGPELSGERLTVAYETKEQEDEHSCFSDNTHHDFICDALGLENVWLGRYRRTSGELISGPGLRDLLQRVDAKLTEKLTAQTAAGVAAARAIPAPFDQAILGPDTAPGRQAVKHAIATFRAESDLFAKAGAALGLKLRF